MNPVGGGGGLFKVPSGGVIVTDSLSSRSVPPTQTSVVGGSRHAHPIPGKNLMDVSMSRSMTTPTPSLYLCDTGRAVNVKKENEEQKEKTSIELLNQAYHVLTRKNIKDSLTSFITTVPGNFDHNESHDFSLRSLIDRPPIGGREFLPISEQSLLGFRLHPGSLPEQYQLDPSTSESSKPHKKKKKHKHRHGDKMDDMSLTNYSPVMSREHSPPADPCDFIKADQTNNFFPPKAPTCVPPTQPTQAPPISSFQPMSHLVSTPQHHLPALLGGTLMATVSGAQYINIQGQPGVIMTSGKFPTHPHATIQGGSEAAAAAALGYQVTPAGLQTAVLLGQDQFKIPTKSKKRRHDNGDGLKKKKKDKKEKRKKKHHDPGALPSTSLPSAIPPTHPAPPPPLVHSSYPPRPP